MTVGGLPIAVLDRADAARMMLRAAREHPRGDRPLAYTSANGEVLAHCDRDDAIAALFAEADQIVADGQSLVLASRLLCRVSLPERVATTDLFHDAARLAETGGERFYMFGATPHHVEKAVDVARAAYPQLDVVGFSHGYLEGEALFAKLAQIDALAPDVLWLGLGVPLEQRFMREHGHRLPNVGMIKTSGGLFDHLAGKTRRAPLVLQHMSLEWLWRMMQEPRRLAGRYLATNPRALLAMLRRSA
ncbi:WecB/TagA/CpsF family glycosyltransferase [Pararhizobium mangrovi]|uniref:WecB/TagA/CpsF family glycosyltransferase n=1 Tax=Pararhizobium mangrovi TaxID=2590452 RepID=A0A506UI57_9HYPH|nr:WecB/TagA/CpsF family glycosyltransferase [Pararhizobium mangrovi]